MLIFVLAFLAGDCYLQFFSLIPGPKILFLSVITSFLISCGLKKWIHFYYVPIAFALGFAWTGWKANELLSWKLTHQQENKPVLLIGYIASLPTTDQMGTHFFFLPTEINKQFIFSTLFFRLSWQTQQLLKVGDQWQFLTRLKSIHGIQSPAAYDYEAWAFQKRLRAHGYIMRDISNKRIAHSYTQFWINQFRQWLQQKLEKTLPQSSNSKWLVALILGEHARLTQEDWRILRLTGTNHLIAIAGLHIGMITGLVYVCFNYLLRSIPRVLLYCPAQFVGAFVSLIIAFVYSALAGFSIPTQRACVMLSIFIFVFLIKRQINSWQGWALSLLTVLIFNPLSVLTESFWLSFGTIALIFYGMSGRIGSIPKWQQWIKVQWIIGVGLIPITLFFYQQCSLVSFIANSIAIPWLSFLILPCCFFGTIALFIFPSLATLLFVLANKNLAFLWIFLKYLSQLPFASWQLTKPPLIILIATLFGFMCLIIPKGMPGRWLGIIWILPYFLYKPDKPQLGEIWLSLLDVGQGLSAVIETTNHTLLYDAGPSYNGRSNMGESVVIPFLNFRGIKNITSAVISHSDNDHAGGFQSIVNTIPIEIIYAADPQKLNIAYARYCLAGLAWQWDKVNFSFIYPPKEALGFKNDSSCVLRIDNGETVILLPGDIEKWAEKILMQSSSRLLPADILVAPHHGSKTSGDINFISAVHPQYVFYATGYLNRYHFPHPTVQKNYSNFGVKQFNTANKGTVTIKIETEKHKIDIEYYRLTHLRYWMHNSS